MHPERILRMKGKIIQITNSAHSWFPCLLIVEEEKSWGVLAYLLDPTDNKPGTTAAAYNRIKTKDFEIVGTAIYLAP